MPPINRILLRSVFTPLLRVIASVLIVVAAWRFAILLSQAHSGNGSADFVERPSGKTPPATTRIYDVHDLIDRWLLSPYFEPPFDPPLKPAGVRQFFRTAGDLVDLLTAEIEQFVEPDGWVDVGGKNDVRTIGTRLIVTAPAAVHEELRKFLWHFRDIEKSPTAPSVQQP